MIGARTVNLVHVADERGAAKVDPASTCRRLQRFFQPVHLPADWAAPLNAGFAGGAEKRTLVLDRTNRKIGETEVNIAVITSLFGKAKTRGLNFEDTRLTDPARLHLLTAIAALAIAWAVRAARTKLGQMAPQRKAHGYLAKSFKTGCTSIRNRLRANETTAILEWLKLKTIPQIQRESCKVNFRLIFLVTIWL